MGNKRGKWTRIQHHRAFTATEEFYKKLDKEFKEKFAQIQEGTTCEELKQFISNYLEERTDDRRDEKKIPPSFFVIGDDRWYCCHKNCSSPEIEFSGVPKIGRIDRHRNEKDGIHSKQLSQHQIICFSLEGTRLQIDSLGTLEKRFRAMEKSENSQPSAQQNSLDAPFAVNVIRNEQEGNSSNADGSIGNSLVDNGTNSKYSDSPDDADFPIPAAMNTHNEFQESCSITSHRDIPGPSAAPTDTDAENEGDYENRVPEIDDVADLDTSFAEINDLPAQANQEYHLDDLPAQANQEDHLYDLPAEANQEEHLDVPVEDQVQEEPNLIQEDYWEAPSLIKNGVPLRIPKSQEHRLQVVHSIYKTEVFKKAFEKLSSDRNRFGLELEKFDPETVHEIFEDLKNEIQKYNDRSPSHPLVESKEWESEKCVPNVAAIIIQYTYEMAIPHPERLNKCKREVENYGETNIAQMEKIFEEIGVKPSDVFVDLGSGVGSLVTYASALNLCYAAGMELVEHRAQEAVIQAEMFQRLMSFFGKKGGCFKLHQGNMLDDKFRKLIIEKATIIFMNNFSFRDLTRQIYEERLQHLKTGTKIIWIKTDGLRRPESNSKSQFTNMTGMCTTKSLTAIEGGVSWTDNPVNFYESTIDNNKITETIEKQKQREKELRDAQKLKREESKEKKENARSRKEQGILLNGEPSGKKQRKRGQKTKSKSSKKLKQE